MRSGERRRTVRRGTNLTRIAGFNEAVLLDAIRRSPVGMSRVELTELTGLSAQTVSNITRRMLEAGLVLEGERVTTGLGKPRTMLSLDPAGQYAVGVHLDPLAITSVVLDLTGTVVAHSQLPTPTTAPPDDVLDLVARAVADLVREAGVDRERLAGIGFASPGPIDAREGVVLDPPHLPGWRDVPLRDRLAHITDLPVVLDKDVVAAAVGENWAGAAIGHANSVFVYLGTGVGVGITVDDEVVRGLTGNAGDLGHLVVDPDGPECSCGLRGCLGVTVTPLGLVRNAVDTGVLPASRLRSRRPDPERVDAVFSELCALSAAGDAGARAVTRTAAVRLAKSVSVLANLVDTEVVVFGGPTWSRLGDQLAHELPGLLEGELVRGRLADLRLTGTALGDDVVAVGAACLVLDRVFSPSAASFAFTAQPVG